uniref:F-box protein At4g35930-like n=1 Tax=Elaeis guineensis var. tenera TaxID=51953 RepID=A0A6I9S5Z2_ELAGV|nr:F-box protein At4g35930-like [Elaeis guineensis]
MPASIDSLPLDILVQILCKLNHDELKPSLVVSKSFHNAALMAQQLHFDFSTPAPKKATMAFADMKDMDMTPGAPSLKLGSRKPRTSKLSEEETRKIAVVLFPVADCKRGLFPKPEWRSCGAAPRYKQSVVPLPNAHA